MLFYILSLWNTHQTDQLVAPLVFRSIRLTCSERNGKYLIDRFGTLLNSACVSLVHKFTIAGNLGYEFDEDTIFKSLVILLPKLSQLQLLMYEIPSKSSRVLQKLSFWQTELWERITGRSSLLPSQASCTASS